MHAEMLIAGHFIGGVCDQSVPKAVIRSPHDGRLVGTAAEGDEAALMTAIAAAAGAFGAWRATTGRERRGILQRVADTVRERRAELAELLVLEIGKPITFAEAEVDRLAVTFGLAASLAEGFGRERLSLDFDSRGGDYTCDVERFPIGVVLGIVPYNWPYNLTAHKVAPALAVGNTVVVKASPQALLCTYALGRVLHDAGVPPGVVNIVDAPVAAVQRAVCDPRIAMVSFTGCEAVGWPLKASLPPQTRCVLELGGDAFAIVCPDAEVEWAVERMTAGAFAYAGQICISLQHALVHATVYDEVVDRLTASTRACPAGDPAARETVCGPLISAAATDRIVSSIDEAVAGGAKILAGGVRTDNVISPCLISGVPQGARLMTAEVFGPVLTIDSVDSLAEAVGRVNASRYGLQASVFTADGNLAEACFRQLDAGAVVINDHPAIRFDNYPYGGVKASGFGREGVAAAMAEMSSPRVRVARCGPESTNSVVG
ncbi:MAG: aldehyde dehydrogenase family protein [Fimbriimonadaceae bacterium]